MKIRQWLIFGLFTAIGGAAWWFQGEGQKLPGFQKPPGGTEERNARPPPVAVATVRQGRVRVVVNALGTVTPRSQVTVRSRVDGELQRVAFHEGQRVEKGDLLAEIDARPFQVQLQLALGQLAKDQAQLRGAQLDLDRYRDLSDKKLIAHQQLDAQVALVQQYQAALQVDQAQMDSAHLQLTYARITAPVAGLVGLRLVDAGNQVRANDSNGLAVITQMHPIDVVFAVPEERVSAIRQTLASGSGLQAEIWERNQRRQVDSGPVTATDNLIDTATGTLRLKAEFANREDTLFPNQFVNVRLILTTLQDQLIVPASAVLRGARGSYLYRIDGENRVTARPIEVLTEENDQVAVTGDLRAGERVVVDGSDKLREDMTVEVIDPAAHPTGVSGKKPDSGRRRSATATP